MTEPTALVIPIQTGGPRNARIVESGDRLYTWRGRDLPSVTTVIKAAGVPQGLHRWALTQLANFVVDNATGLATRAVMAGSAERIAILKAEVAASASEKRDNAADLGTRVHEACALMADPETVSPDVASRLRQFYAWLAESGAEVLGSEFQVWNLGLGYAGSVDLLVRFPNGAVYVIDLKTGDLYLEHALQLTAYGHGEFVGADDVIDPHLTALLHEVTGVAVLHLGARHWKFHVLRFDEATWSAFRGLLAVSSWLRAHGSPDDITTATRRSA